MTDNEKIKVWIERAMELSDGEEHTIIPKEENLPEFVFDELGLPNSDWMIVTLDTLKEELGFIVKCFHSKNGALEVKIKKTH